MEPLSEPLTRRERRQAERQEHQFQAESAPTLLEKPPVLVPERFVENRFEQYSSFDELMAPSWAAEVEKHETGRFATTGAEWCHAMLMEFLRVPIMVPVWWAGMQLCDVAWLLR